MSYKEKILNLAKKSCLIQLLLISCERRIRLRCTCEFRERTHYNTIFSETNLSEQQYKTRQDSNGTHPTSSQEFHLPSHFLPDSDLAKSITNIIGVPCFVNISDNAINLYCIENVEAFFLPGHIYVTKS